MVKLAALVLVAVASSGCALAFEVLDGSGGSGSPGDGGACAPTCRSALEDGGAPCADPAAEYYTPLFECACGSSGACLDECGAGLCSNEPVLFPSAIPGGPPGDACFNCIQANCGQPYNGCLLHGG